MAGYWCGEPGKRGGVAIAVWLLTDLLHVWTPSLITLFGRTAETPAEVMGSFALGVVALPFIPLALRRPKRGAAVACVLAALGVRLVLLVNPSGGSLQLYGSSAGVVLGICALCLLAGTAGSNFFRGFALGVAAAATAQAFLGTWGAAWRHGGWGWGVLAFQALIVVWATVGFLRRPASDERRGGPREPASAAAPSPNAAPEAVAGSATDAAPDTTAVPPPESASEAAAGPIGVRAGALVFSILLVTQLGLVNVGRTSALQEVWSPPAAVAGAWVAWAVAHTPRPRRRPWIPAIAFTASAFAAVALEADRGGVPGSLSWWALPAFVVGPPAAPTLLQHALGRGRRAAAPRPPRRADVGAIVWIVVCFVFYAGYDLGYRADAAIVGLAAAVGVVALIRRAPASRHTPAAHRLPLTSTSGSAPPRPALRLLSAPVACALALLGPVLTVHALPAAASGGSAADSGLTIATYNTRMGYGMDGTFAPDRVARQIRSTGARVVMLNEVDRGWLLNGGQDQLAVLARLLGMHIVFGPAGDQVWGDAILTDLPVREVSVLRYPLFDAVTGAGITSATVRWQGSDIRVMATHFQPDGDVVDATGGQAGIFADELSRATVAGPVVAGGDLNTTVGSAPWRSILGTGVQDALAPIRPARTWSAEAPQQELDHLFTHGLKVSDPRVVGSQLSDHLMVVITVRPKARS